MMEIDTKMMLSILIFGIACSGMGAALAYGIQGLASKIPTSKVYYSDANCSGLNLTRTAWCLEDRLAKFYRYNVTNVDRNLSLEQLKAEGGVCWQFSDWYADNIKSLGNFHASEVIIDTGRDTRHEYAVISDGSGYCILDQLNVHCTRLEGGNL